MNQSFYFLTLGMEAPLFSELLRRPSQMEEQFFPRLLAFAERVWHKADWESEKDEHKYLRLRAEDWQRHVNNVGYRELKQLDRLNINYRVSPPGVKSVIYSLRVRISPGILE